MEKQKYLYKNSKCVGGTSSTISLINAWISITGQRNLQKYRSIAYLGGFTIIAFATIWFLSQSPTYTIEYDSKEKSGKSDKSNKSDKSDKSNKKGDPGKSDKRSNKSSWWSSIREKIENKLGFNKKSKSQKNATKIGKPSNSRNNINSNGSNKNGKKRTPKDNGNTSSKTSDVKQNGPTGKTTDVKQNGPTGKTLDIKQNGPSIIRNNTHGGAKSTNIIKNDKSIGKKVQGTRIDSRTQKDQITQEIRAGSNGDSSSFRSNNLRQKDQNSSSNNWQQKYQDGSYGDSSSSRSNNLRQKERIQVANNNEVKQQQLRKLKLKAKDTRSSNWTNRYKVPSRCVEDKYRLGDCSIYKHPEKVNSTSPIRNVKCLTKSLCQDIDNKESSRQGRPLTDLEIKIAESIKKINSIDLQVGEKYREFYIPYTPLTLHETFDKIGQDRVERYKKLLAKLGRQKQQDSDLEFTLKMVKEFFHEKKYYESEEDEDCHEKRADKSDEFDDFFEKLANVQNLARTNVTNKDSVDCDNCPKFADVLVQDEQASRKRIERNFEILKMLDSYQQQGKETETSIKKSIEMFHEQSAQHKGATRHLKRPSRFYDELDRFEDRLKDTGQQAKDLATSLDDMEAYLKEMLELFNDDDKMNTAATKYGPILIDDDD